MLLRTTALLAGSVRAMTTLTFVTGNAKKLAEVAESARAHSSRCPPPSYSAKTFFRHLYSVKKCLSPYA